MPIRRAIIHVDMDAFFASVEELDNPEYSGHAVIVGGLGPRGVVSAANYAARKFGVHSAMPIGRARRLCPQGIYCRGNMSRYREISTQVFSIFKQFTPLVEGLSLDEAFLDVTASRKVLGDIETIGMAIKNKILQQTGLVASVGMAENKFLAKLASDFRKPDGFFRVPDNAHDFLDPMPVGRLWGVGPKTEQRIKQAGILTVGQLRRANMQLVESALGAQATHFQSLARGEDQREVIPTRSDKSISHEQTFDTDLNEQRQMLAVLQKLSEQVGRRLRKKKYTAQVIRLKVRSSRFQTFSRQISLIEATDSGKAIYSVSKALLNKWLQQHPGTAVRLLGVGTSKLENNFAIPNNRQTKTGIESVLDEINDKFGEQTVAPTLGKLR
ncbi:MAG: DNA polymerase IV [Xanthomonadales bacterium]|nr:DNA polymerase IV [Xanthomonadales bacterium]